MSVSHEISLEAHEAHAIAAKERADAQNRISPKVRAYLEKTWEWRPVNSLIASILEDPEVQKTEALEGKHAEFVFTKDVIIGLLDRWFNEGSVIFWGERNMANWHVKLLN